MNQLLRIDQLDQSLRANGRIESQHAGQLRKMIYAKGTVTKEDAATLFRLDRACSKKDPKFAALYVEALTDYFVWQTEPKGYVTAEQSAYLIENVANDGHVSSKTELELLLNIVHWAREVPGRVDRFGAGVGAPVRVAVAGCASGRQSSARGHWGGRCRDFAQSAACAGRRRRSAGYAARSGVAVHIERSDGAGDNDKAWTELFTLALANHLLNPMNPPQVPTRDEAVHRERWLDERGSMGRMLTAAVTSLASGDVPFAGVWESLDPTGAVQARKEADAERKSAKLRLSREQIDAGEAQWLCERILRDGSVDENERALLVFLRKEAAHIDPALEPAMKRAGV